MTGPLFKRVDCDVEYLVSAIDQGTVGLPEMQRPFVWPTTKVRDLFDSMFKGYPIGYLLLWASDETAKVRQIGVGQHGTDTPSTLIIDGQQRLTSLYSVMRGKPVLDKDFSHRKLTIAFRPLTGDFAVATAAHKKDPEWLSDISDIYTRSDGAYLIISQFIAIIKKHRGTLSAEEESDIADNIQRLLQLKKYPFSALEINAQTDEEDVSNIFVRVNSAGTDLGQADFILTLMSVFWEDGRRALDSFCRESRIPSVNGATPYNQFIQPDPDQLIRVSVGYGFRRARLKYAYLILRGKDLETGEFTEERRKEQLARLTAAQARVLDLQNWHEFLKSVMQAGYIRGDMISSATSLLYAYVFYLIGKYDYGLSGQPLRRAISRWFFMSTLTGRYSSNFESQMEQDLADLRSVKSSVDFLQHIDNVIASVLTPDFWTITLPTMHLATASHRSPAWFAYCAALCICDAPVLFSDLKVSQLLNPIADAKKSAIERHHLFPKQYLASIDIADDRDRNQIANYALVEWIDNVEISDDSPAKYLPKHIERFQYDPARLHEFSLWHALPANWETMDYYSFLEERRKLMAAIIRKGYERI